jgi:ribosomal protein L11 methyltransferase
MPAARYWELALATPEDVADAFVNFLWEHRALGVVEAPAGPALTFLQAFFPPDTDVPQLEAGVRAYLEGLTALGFQVRGEARLTPLADRNWGEAWREHFRPIRVGRRLLVVPPWERRAATGGRVALVVEPGRAFGTGHHGSTASCLMRLESVVRPAPSRAIDLGTGSGILAIAALKLGVGRVLAVDEDPDAIASARANAARNGVAAAMRCVQGDAASLRARPAPLVLANLLAALHLRLAPRYASLVAPGGALLLGGILNAEAAGVRSALEPHGFALAGVSCNDGWSCVELRRPGRAKVRRR